MSLLPKSIHRCRCYPTKFNSGRDIPSIRQWQGLESNGHFQFTPPKGLPWFFRDHDGPPMPEGDIREEDGKLAATGMSVRHQLP